MERLVLGANPLVGVNHFSADRARELASRLTNENAMQVVQSAIKGGASGFTFSPGFQSLEILKQLRSAGEGSRVKLYPVLPALEKYWPAFLAGGTVGLIDAVFEDLSWRGKAKALFRGSAVTITSSPETALRLYIDVEFEKIRNNSPNNWQVDVAFLGETLTDLAISLGAYDMLQSFCHAVESHRGVRAGFQTINFAKLVTGLSSSGKFDTLPPIMAPFNPLGFQMTPDRATCEGIAASIPGIEVIGISILAAGQLPLDRAIAYIKDKKYLVSVAVGTSNPDHARETFTKLNSVLLSRSSMHGR